jgi:type IV pilus assembly protein PilX
MKGQASTRQHGMALISGLLLLLVVTILGISMFRSFGIQARIAGNTREKQRALHAAEGAQAYAEWWVSQSGGGNATMGNPCSGIVTITGPADVQVCSNQLAAATVTNGPWQAVDAAGKSNQVGFSYPVPNMCTDTTKPGCYVQMPMLYVGYLNGSYDKGTGTQTNNYRVDASGYGGTLNTVAVVESSYQVQVTYTTQLSNSKFYSLTGP